MKEDERDYGFLRERLKRQITLFGLEAVEEIARIVLTIVGCGGNGGIFALISAYAGFYLFNLVDPDRLNLHNLNRTTYAGYKDAVQNRLKVDVLKKRLLSIDPDIKGNTFPLRIQDSRESSALQNCDVIIDATDNITTKKYLQQYCSDNEKILGSMGSGGYVRDGRIVYLGSQFTYYEPGGACLFCGPLDMDEVTWFSRISFLPPNSIIASIAVEHLFAKFTGYDSECAEPANFYIYDSLRHEIVKLFRISRRDCPYCGKEGKK
ncbi:MAG: ThiF family adenylyltransferase [Candidatus Lokiarchaeia archaeon]